MGWFVGLAVVTWVGVSTFWSARPGVRPAIRRTEDGHPVGLRYRVTGIAGAVAVAGACGWNLRGLSTPTVGFDARAVWLMRGGGSSSPITSCWATCACTTWPSARAPTLLWSVPSPRWRGA